MPWILNIAYLALLTAVSPLLLYRALVQGKYREGWRQKLFGQLPARSDGRPCLWLHAVSVGEVLQLQSVVRELESRLPGFELVISTTTSTGYAVAREKFPQHLVCYFPLDFSWAVRAAIRRLQPSAIVLVELELWPNFILAAGDARIPLALINGRIGERSSRGYRRIRPLMRRLLEKFSLLAIQSDAYADRLRELGAPADRLHVTGSIKFDGVQVDRSNPRTAELRKTFGIADGESVFIAGSTQAPEEELAIRSWLALRGDHPDLRLILVPRHKERFDEVANLVARLELPLIRRTGARGQRAEGRRQKAEGRRQEAGGSGQEAGGSGPEAKPTGRNPWEQAATTRPTAQPAQIPPVLLLDTLGELGACWGLADIAFVGGSLTNRGGQNMLEPAAYGAALLFGPNTHNFRQIVELLLSHRAARVVHNGDDLTAAVRHFLNDPQAALEQGRLARDLVLSQQGATSRTVSLVCNLVAANSQTPQALHRDAASRVRAA